MSKTSAKIQLFILKNIPFILFVLIFIIFGILSPRFFRYDNFENIVTSGAYIGIVTVGMTFVLLIGGIDLSVGSNMFLSAACTGLLIQNYSFPTLLALLCGVVIGALFGAFNAFCIVKLRILAFLVTLSTLVAGRGLTLLLTHSQTVPLPESISSLGANKFLGMPITVIIYIVIVIFAFILQRFVPLGRQIYAVGNDLEGAKKAGINTDRIVYFVYVFSGFLAGIAGIVSVSQLGAVLAGFGEGVEFKAISATVLGGTSLFGGVGTILPGAVIGTVLIQMVQSGLVYVQMDLYIQPIMTSGVIFMAVFLDSLRNRQILKLESRKIRVEK
jgi:ribose transport system permease protein